MPIDTSRPRATGGYDFATHGQTNTSQGNNYVLRRSVNAEYYKPSWKNTLTTFRPMPAKNPDGSLTPYRKSAAVSHFGDWIRGCLIHNGGVNHMLSFLLHDPTLGEFDPANSPSFVLYNAINSAVNAGQARSPSWAPMLKGGPGRGAQLSKPGTIFVSQGFLIEHNSKIFNPLPRGADPQGRVLVFGMPGNGPQAAGQKVVAALNEWVPGANEDTPGKGPNGTDFRDAFVHGDPLAYDDGCYFRFCEGGGQLSAQAPQAGYGNGQVGQMGQQGGGNTDIKGYDVQVVKTVYNVASSVPGFISDAWAHRACKWDELLYFPSVQEQALYLARAYPADVIEFAFSDHQDWLTDEVMQIVRARTQSGGGMPPSGYGQGHGAYPPAGNAPQYGGAGYGQQNQQAYGHAPQSPQAGYGQPAGQQAYGQAPPQAGYGQAPPAGHIPGPAQPTTPAYGAAPAHDPAALPQNPAAGGQAPSWGNVPFGVPGADPAVRQAAMPAPNYGQPAAAPAATAPAAPVAAPPATPGAPVDPRQAALDYARSLGNTAPPSA